MHFQMKVILLVVFIVTLINLFLMEIFFKDKLHGIYSTAFRSSISGENSQESFLEVIGNFPWNEFKIALSNTTNKTNVLAVDQFLTSLISGLVPWVVKEPLVKINSSCGPEVTENDKIPECVLEAKIRGFEGRRMGILLQLGFDVDTLEIHLNQLSDIVDRFFVIEATQTHFRGLRKPLIWEQIRQQPRFKRFEDLVTHFILDDEEMFAGEDSRLEITWDREQIQERRRWEKFLKWNNHTEMFREGDFLGFGDVDEIPSRSAVLRLKYCDIRDDPLDIGIWFPYGNINQASLTDWPVRNLDFTLGDPTFWRLKTATHFAKNYGRSPGRQRGKSKSSLLGGMHMSHYGYLPFQLLKRITQTEVDGPTLLQLCKSIVELLSKSKSVKQNSTELLIQMEALFSAVPSSLQHRIFALKELYASKEPRIEEIVVLPWFYNCNRKRYPAWEKEHDKRLD